jgi:uncharacterized alpha/beta hydrolase family protein
MVFIPDDEATVARERKREDEAMAKEVPIVVIEGIDGVRRPIHRLVSWWLRTHDLPATQGLVLKVPSFLLNDRD